MTSPLRPQSAEQWLARQGLADLSLYWPTNKPLPQIDYASGEARPTLIELLEAYARAAAPAATLPQEPHLSPVEKSALDTTTNEV